MNLHNTSVYKFSKLSGIACKDEPPDAVGEMTRHWDGNSVRFGETVTYSCHASHELSDGSINQTVTCEDTVVDGNWTTFENCSSMLIQIFENFLKALLRQFTHEIFHNFEIYPTCPCQEIVVFLRRKTAIYLSLSLRITLG